MRKGRAALNVDGTVESDMSSKAGMATPAPQRPQGAASGLLAQHVEGAILVVPNTSPRQPLWAESRL